MDGGATVKNKTILTGQKRIMAFVGRSWKTIHKWILEDNFPATKIEGIWESDEDLIRRWRKRQIVESQNHKQPRVS